VTELDYVRSVLLGAIQGLTEFLPISSSAHLALTQRWMGLDADGPGMLLFDVLAHVGTLIAVLIVFGRPGWRFSQRILRESSGAFSGRRFAWRVVALGVAATIPTAVVGLAFQGVFEAAFDKPKWIGAALIVTGALLAATKMLGRQSRGWRKFSWWQAVLVGLAQACAILPGISRSGSTICVACYCGLRRRWAAEFSFLIAVPAIAGATLLKLKDTLELPKEQLAGMAWGPIVTGSVVSLIVGIVALKTLLTAVRRGQLHYFAVYVWLLGALLLAGVVG